MMPNPWLALACDAARLGYEAQRVIALRLVRLAAGGAVARAEAQRMVTEKATTLVEAQMGAAAELVKGRKPEAAVKKAMGIYNKRVAANKRRLSRIRAKG
jgi:hypothetical protein